RSEHALVVGDDHARRSRAARHHVRKHSRHSRVIESSGIFYSRGRRASKKVANSKSCGVIHGTPAKTEPSPVGLLPAGVAGKTQLRISCMNSRRKTAQMPSRRR